MRIGILTGEYPPMQGGIGAHCDVLARKFVEQGQHVFVFSGDGTQVQTPDIPLTTHRGWGIGCIQAVGRWAKENQLDVINLHFQTAAYNMSAVIHFLPNFVQSPPIVTTFHDLRFPYLFPKAGRLRDDILMHLAKSSAGIIVTNHEDFQRIQHLKNSQIIPIGSSILFSQIGKYDRTLWRERAGVGENEFLIAHFGFINHSKGVDMLLYALLVLRQQGIPAHLLMIGGRTGTADPTNAAYAKTIDDLIEQLQLESVITWTGFVKSEQVSAFLRAADVVALPFRDGASYRRSSLMAAIHHGCVIVTTKPRIEIPAFINGENMMTFPADDPVALADLLRSLYAVPSLGKTLKQGVHELRQQFNWDTIARDNVAFFQRVIGFYAS